MTKRLLRKHRLVKRILTRCWGTAGWYKFSPAWHYWMKWIGNNYGTKLPSDKVIIKRAVESWKKDNY